MRIGQPSYVLQPMIIIIIIHTYIPPMSGRSLLSQPSSKLFKMCVTSLSQTFGVSTHVLLVTSSSSLSFWRELLRKRNGLHPKRPLLKRQCPSGQRNRKKEILRYHNVASNYRLQQGASVNLHLQPNLAEMPISLNLRSFAFIVISFVFIILLQIWLLVLN